MSYKLVFPEDFDDYAWEVEAKGWFTGVVIEFEESIIPLLFYDAVRLAQDVEESIFLNRVFAERNIVVVSSVNRMCIEAAVEILFKSGDIRRLS